jgi:hypothetical protein
MALAVGSRNGAARGTEIYPDVNYVAAIFYQSTPFRSASRRLLA